MTRDVVSAAAEAALALVLLASAIEKVRLVLKGKGPLHPAIAAIRISSNARSGLVAASMAADLLGALMLVIWPAAGLAFTSFLIAVYTRVGVATLRRTGGGDCGCLGGNLDARTTEGLMARNLWLLGIGLVALALGPVALASSAREPEAWLILLGFLGGVAVSVRLGDAAHRRGQRKVVGRSHQEADHQPWPEAVGESAASERQPTKGCCQTGPVRGDPLPEGLRSRIELAGRRPPLVVGFVSEVCSGCRQLLTVLEQEPELASSGRVVLVAPRSSTALWRAASDLGVEVIQDDGELWTESNVGDPPLLVAVGADGSVIDKGLSPHIDRFGTRLSIFEPTSKSKTRTDAGS